MTTGAVVGGSFSRVLGASESASATVNNSVVTINGGTSIAGVVGGGQDLCRVRQGRESDQHRLHEE